jgi:hypothetical protein
MIKSKPGTREEDRQTEDEIARKKWARAAYLVPLDTAKMTPQEDKNIPKSGEFDGHTAQVKFFSVAARRAPPKLTRY